MNNFLKKKIYFILLIVILFLSLFLRVYKVNTNPPSLDWDEASIGYNAYSILKTGADEYGNKFPLSIRSFDDYKPPLYVYLDVPSIAVFGLNETGVRFPAALAGFLCVLVIYFLVKENFYNWEKNQKEKIALLSAFFLGVSPWHLQFSRAAFEGNLGLFFFILGFLFFLKALKNPKLIFISVISFCLSIYSYHSFRLVIPIFIISSVIYFWKEIWTNKKYYFAAFIVGTIFAIPVFLSFTSDKGGASRFSMVSSFSSDDVLSKSIKQLEYDKSHKDFLGQVLHNRRVVYFLVLAKGYFDHWNPDFLFLHGDGGRQHHAVDMGMLYLWDFPFILLGLHALFNRRTKRILLLIIMFLIAPLPSAIATGSPHPVRAIAMAPAFSIFTAVGIYFAFFRDKKRQTLIFLGIASIFFILNFSYYLHQYYVHTPLEYGDFWQYGHKEAFQDAKSLGKKYDKIIFTYKYDQPYIYYLFDNKIDPSWYQNNWDYLKTGQTERMRRVIGKYEFRNIDWSKDRSSKNTLLIGSPQEIPHNAPGLLKTIYFPDRSVAFRIVGT